MEENKDQLSGELDELLRDIYNLIVSAETIEPEPLSSSSFTRLIGLLDRAIALAATPEEYQAVGRDNVWWELPEIANTIDGVIARLSQEFPSLTLDQIRNRAYVASAEKMERYNLPLLSLLLFWKGWSYQFLDPEQEYPLVWSTAGLVAERFLEEAVVQLPDKDSIQENLFAHGIAICPIRNFELIEDSYIKSIKSCTENDAPSVMLSYMTSVVPKLGP